MINWSKETSGKRYRHRSNASESDGFKMEVDLGRMMNLRGIVKKRGLAVEMKVRKDKGKSQSFFSGVLKTRPTRTRLLECVLKQTREGVVRLRYVGSERTEDMQTEKPRGPGRPEERLGLHQLPGGGLSPHRHAF